MIKTILLSTLTITVLGVSVYGVNLALDLKQSCNTKVEAGQTCTTCVKVKDLIKDLGLEK